MSIISNALSGSIAAQAALNAASQNIANLQTAGYISYRRGHISVLNRKGLETHTCECYGVVRKELARLLTDVRSPVTA